MIVIPMAGLSQRFVDAGYKVPKYMLPLHGRTVFAHAVDSFRALFASGRFLFIARDVASSARFIRAECDGLGLESYTLTVLDQPTAGQAETVERGLDDAGVAAGEPLTIFNIDTFRRDFEYPTAAWFAASAGYLEVFRGAGANWSYVRPAPADEPLVRETTEKVPISDLCCGGLYHFASAADFRLALAAERRSPSSPELYVAPLYNQLIALGRRIHYAVVRPEQLVFCGVPAEYRMLLDNPPFP